jgi:hypothetical protein
MSNCQSFNDEVNCLNHTGCNWCNYESKTEKGSKCFSIDDIAKSEDDHHNLSCIASENVEIDEDPCAVITNPDQCIAQVDHQHQDQFCMWGANGCHRYNKATMPPIESTELGINYVLPVGKDATCNLITSSKECPAGSCKWCGTKCLSANQFEHTNVCKRETILKHIPEPISEETNCDGSMPYDYLKNHNFQDLACSKIDHRHSCIASPNCGWCPEHKMCVSNYLSKSDWCKTKHGMPEVININDPLTIHLSQPLNINSPVQYDKTEICPYTKNWSRTDRQDVMFDFKRNQMIVKSSQSNED